MSWLTTDQTYLTLGGVTNNAYGDITALRVRFGTETKWEWRNITEAEYQIMLESLRRSIPSPPPPEGKPEHEQEGQSK